MQKNHGGPAKGSWGDRYIIENSKESKKISCSKCINYCDEDRLNHSQEGGHVFMKKLLRTVA